jgi:hypothetical protein
MAMSTDIGSAGLLAAVGAGVPPQRGLKAGAAGPLRVLPQRSARDRAVRAAMLLSGPHGSWWTRLSGVGQASGYGPGI